MKASEWALKRVREAHLCGYHCGDETAICCCGEIAVALDEARAEGAERERWECWSDIERYLHTNASDMTQQAKDAFMFIASRLIAARGPMRGPEEGE